MIEKLIYLVDSNQNQVNYKTIKPLLGKSKRRILSAIYKNRETLMPHNYRLITRRLIRF